MSNKQVVFSDRLVNAVVHNGLVRLDFAVFANATQDKDGKTALQFEPTHQLVMPFDAFAAAFAAQEKVIKELAAMEQRRRDSVAAAAAPGQAAAGGMGS